MKKYLMIFIITTLSILIVTACSNSGTTETDTGNDEDKTSLIAGSGTTGGVYYPYMGELATIFNNNIDIEGFDVNVVATGGSVENVAKTTSGEFQISLAQNNLTNDAINGVGEFEGGEGAENLGVIASLFPEVVQ